MAFPSTMAQSVAGLMWTLYLFHLKFPTDLTVFMFRRHGKKDTNENLHIIGWYAKQ